MDRIDRKYHCKEVQITPRKSRDVAIKRRGAQRTFLRTARRFLVIAIPLMLLLSAEIVWGRAGGGGGYGGGGGGGGGFGGGGGGYGGGGSGGNSGGPIYLIYFGFRYPWIGVPLLVVFIYFCKVGGKQGTSAYQGSVIRRGNDLISAQQQQQAIDAILQDDPSFDQAVFGQRATAAFIKIQHAWSQQNLPEIRAFVSDGIYERFSLQIEEQRDLGYRNPMENLSVHSATIAQLKSDDFFRAITVRIQASATDYRVSLENGRKIAGTERDDNFVEFWTFLRRCGAATSQRSGLIEGNCPNCGAVVELNQSAKCTSCDTLVRSGQYDWVLVKITQQSEWDPRPVASAMGVAAYRSRFDNTFNLSHLEDRASVIFWRKAMADRLGDVRPLAKMASKSFNETYAEQFAGEDSSRRYRGDCAVGAVETRGMLPGNPMDRALVEVHWSGASFSKTADARPRQLGQPTLFRTMMVLGRKSGVTTNLADSISSAHCPSCGAPESLLSSHACEFCGEVQVDGSHDWVLLEWHSMISDPAQRLLAEAKQLRAAAQEIEVTADQYDAIPHHTPLIAWMIQMALADNHLDDQEHALLRRVAAARNVSPSRLEILIATAREGTMEIPQPDNSEQARRWLTAMVDTSLSDGKIHADEVALLKQAGASLNYSAYDINTLFKQRKTKLYRKAREDLRLSRQQS